MNPRSYRTFQALVLAASGLFLFGLVWSGSILLYINRRFVLPVFLASIGLLALAQVVFRQRACETEGEELSAHGDEETRSPWNLWWLALPVIIGLLIPSRPLGSYSFGQRGINAAGSLVGGRALPASSLSLPPGQRTVLDWIRVFGDGKSTAGFDGQPADVIGFVYHDPRLPAGQFMVGRFAVTCCVADALAIGMVIDAPQVSGLQENSWVRVQGNSYTAQVDGRTLPGIRAASVTTVPEPDDPYLFP